MSGIRELLIRGSEKVIGHYRLLLPSAKTRRNPYRQISSSCSATQSSSAGLAMAGRLLQDGAGEFERTARDLVGRLAILRTLVTEAGAS